MNFEENIDIKYESLEETTIFLRNKNIDINDILLFDQFINLKNFSKRQDSSYFSQNSSTKLCIFFKSNNNITSYSEILKISQYFFCIPGHNANTERIFSLISSQWTKERNRLSIESIRDSNIAI